MKALNWKENSFYTYHKFLGCKDEIDCNDDWNLNITYSESQILSPLKYLVKDKKTVFRSKAQKEMMYKCCNMRGRHKLYVVGCGEGKTLNITIPIYLEYILGQKQGTRIFLLPYSFLAEFI